MKEEKSNPLRWVIWSIDLICAIPVLFSIILVEGIAFSIYLKEGCWINSVSKCGSDFNISGLVYHLAFYSIIIGVFLSLLSIPFQLGKLAYFMLNKKGFWSYLIAGLLLALYVFYFVNPSTAGGWILD